MLKAEGICKKYLDRSSGQSISILNNCNINIADGEIVGLMGKSGSGKSTLARILLSIARALLLEPKMLVLDEPTSMLDISVQAQILHRLKNIQQDRKLAYLLITHDSSIANWLCDRVVKLN